MLIRIKVDGQKVSKWKSGRSNNFKTSTVLKFRNERSRTGDNQNSTKWIPLSGITLSLIALWFYNFLTPNALTLTLRELSLWVYPTLSAMAVYFQFLRPSTISLLNRLLRVFWTFHFHPLYCQSWFLWTSKFKTSSFVPLGQPTVWFKDRSLWLNTVH